jgi:hypothetical protein
VYVGGYSRFTVNVSAGSYVLRFRYAGVGAASRSLFVDGVEVSVPGFAATGGWGPGSTWRTVDVPVVLGGGSRVIELRRTASNVGEINLDSLAVHTVP